MFNALQTLDELHIISKRSLKLLDYLKKYWYFLLPLPVAIYCYINSKKH